MHGWARLDCGCTPHSKSSRLVSCPPTTKFSRRTRRPPDLHNLTVTKSKPSRQWSNPYTIASSLTADRRSSEFHPAPGSSQPIGCRSWDICCIWVPVVGAPRLDGGQTQQRQLIRRGGINRSDTVMVSHRSVCRRPSYGVKQQSVLSPKPSHRPTGGRHCAQTRESSSTSRSLDRVAL